MVRAVGCDSGEREEHVQPQACLGPSGTRKHDLELVFHWSSHDRFYPFWDFDARRDAKSLVATLEKTGYSPTISESDDGFGWGMWQGRMAEVLEALFPLR